MSSNEYMRQYMAARRSQRKSQLIEMLGGRCSRCKVTEDLEFDHVDPSTKVFQISGRGLDKPWEVLVAEAMKCQLLCRCHHVEKSRANGELRTVDHGGGLAGKRNCPCRPCKDKRAEYMKEYGHPSRVAQ